MSTMTRKMTPVPKFATEANERAFWEAHDSSEHVDLNLAFRARFQRIGRSLETAELRDKLLAGRNSPPGPPADHAYFEQLRSRLRHSTDP